MKALTGRRLAIGVFAVNVAVIVFSLAGTASLRYGPAPENWDYELIARIFTLLNIVTCAFTSLLLMASTQGIRRVGLLLGLSLVVAGGLEYLSVKTGSPFGPYHYTDRLGPMIAGTVPYLIPIAWAMMLYPGLQIGAVLGLSRAKRAVLAGVMVTVWDLALDPAMTIGFHAWQWDWTSIYYDIPLHNFVAWFATGFIICALYYALSGPWKDDASWFPAAIYLTQSFFAVGLAMIYGRLLTGAVWLTGLALLALAVVHLWRSRKDIFVDEAVQAR